MTAKSFMLNRHRRLRSSKTLRDFVRETRLHPDNLLQPFFVIEGHNKRQAIHAMPGIARLSVDVLLKDMEMFVRSGGRGGVIFGMSNHKDNSGQQAYSAKGIVPAAIKAIKKNFPEFLLVSDVCLCAHLKHGHCGIVRGGKIDNDATLPVLAEVALSHAQAGADLVAPSDMMDFRVGVIRQALDKNGFLETGLLSYAVKYVSSFYGPFREAAHSTPAFGDRKTYQMDPGNAREALKEARADVAEGADIVMVKPATAYLDIVSMLRQDLTVPIAAFHVSGEYSMIKAAAQQGWVDEKAMVLETLLCIKRAGADLIITYHAQDILKWKLCGLS